MLRNPDGPSLAPALVLHTRVSCMCVVSCMLRCPLESCSVVHGVSYVIEVGERVGLHRTVTGPRHTTNRHVMSLGVQARVSRRVRAVYTETCEIHEIP